MYKFVVQLTTVATAAQKKNKEKKKTVQRVLSDGT